MLKRALFFLSLAAFSLQAQNGDHAGETQTNVVPPELIPPSPVVPAPETLKNFQIVPGFKIELIASEPLVHDPIAISFDPDGRIWVVEMIGFMRNPDGLHEEEPVANIVVLEDTDGDGKMDKRTVFMSHLVMPRALALIRDGVLVAEPPHLWFARDTNGDGIEDEKEEVAKDYGNQNNPEHNSNGLMLAMDNWIYSANHTTRFRNIGGDWQRQPTVFRGQWGISQDNYGRLVYNSNSDQFRIDLVPSAYLFRNPNYRTPIGINVDPIKNQKTWPARVTPAVNRGYQKRMLRPDGKLAEFTAACGPVIYRGDNFPPEFQGNAFVCEPSANLIKRDILTETNGVMTGRQAYDHSEFLASTDERFRPVNAYNGPDGALYLVDMYHGIIQHRVYLTSYLRKQSLSRNLEQPTGLGRIYRIVREGTNPSAKPRMAKASTAELVAALSHPNGWRRDTAQRLLIERGNPQAAPLVKQVVLHGDFPLGRLQALWTLEGLDELDAKTIIGALSDSDPKVRAAAIRLSEVVMRTQDRNAVVPAVLKMAADPVADVQLQLAFTLGEAHSPEADAVLAEIGSRESKNPYICEAILTSLGGKEVEFVGRLLASGQWSEKINGREKLISGLAKCVLLERKTNHIDHLMALAATAASWQRMALMDGMLASTPPATRGRAARPPKVIRFPVEPAGFTALNAAASAEAAKKMALLEKLVTWPGQPGYVPPPYVAPLTPAQLTQFDTGKSLFTVSCAVCHQPNGLGQAGLAPPLAGSEWALGSENRVIRIALNGARGRFNVLGTAYDLEMPSLSVFPDDQIAAILTYVRREWENTADPVTPESVAAIRKAIAGREEGWSEAELLKIK
jgi:putative membrane-bound dehydrogenase-like protein